METRGDMQHQLKAAGRNNRSLNRERLARLTASVRPGADAVEALLARIRRRHRDLGPLDVSEATLRDLRDEGRP